MSRWWNLPSKSTRIFLYISCIAIIVIGVCILFAFNIAILNPIMKILSYATIKSMIIMTYITGFSIILFGILGIFSGWLKHGFCKTIFVWLFFFGMILVFIFFIAVLLTLGFAIYN